MLKRKKPIFTGILTIVFVLLLSIAVQVSFNNKSTKEISYPKFLEMVDKKEIKQVYINFSSDDFKAISNDNKIYKVPNPKYTNFKKDLLMKNVEIKTMHVEVVKLILHLASSLLPMIIILLILDRYVSKSTGNSKFKMDDSSKLKVPNVKFDDIAGNEEVKAEMLQIIDFLKNPKKYKERGVKFPKGILFYGPPGTGKTLTAKAIAGECNVPFINSNGSDFIEMYSGLGAKRVRDLFKLARSKAPCILFIDEVDAIGTKRGVGSNENEKNQTINALLSEMDGFNSSDGVLVISATNRLEDLDPALTRAGRFDKHIKIPLPEAYERLAIIKRYAKDKKISKDVSLDSLSKETIGFSGADIDNLINEANFLSVSKGKESIDKEDFDDAYFKIIMKGHKKPISKNKEEVKLIAWHETGHALANLLLPNGDEVNKVTIIPSSSGAGGVTITTPEKMGLYSKEYIETKIKVCYAGRIGELLLLNDELKITTGASQDIKQATEYIKGYISEYGMHEEFGMLNLSQLGVDDELLTKDAVKLSKRLYKETFDLLKKNLPLFNLITNKLIEKETLTGKELKEIIDNNISSK